MTQRAMCIVIRKASPLKLFTPPSKEALELLEFLPHATASATSFTRRQNKLRNPQFLDEAIAEAWAIASDLFLIPGSLTGIKEKCPEPEHQIKFLKATIGHELKQYFSLRATSTISFLKKKGIVTTHTSLTDTITSADNTLEADAWDHAVRDEFERWVVELHMQGWDNKKIASECNCSAKAVNKTLTKIKRRLQHSNVPTTR